MFFWFLRLLFRQKQNDESSRSSVFLEDVDCLVLHRADSGFLRDTFFLRDLRISPETLLSTEWNSCLFLFVCCRFFVCFVDL